MPATVKPPKNAKTNKDGLTQKEQEIADRVGAATTPVKDEKKIPKEYLYRFPKNQRAMFEFCLKKDNRNIKNGIEFLIWSYIRNHPSYDPKWEPEETLELPE